MVDNYFFDSNVLLYLASEDMAKAARAERLLRAGGTISVQVLNELAHVARRKMKLSVVEVRDWLRLVRWSLKVQPVTEATHDTGMSIAARYRFSTYDAMIVASAAIARCDVLYSEDMQHGLQTDVGVTIIDPFR